MWKLRVLHISDLHERGPRETESFRRRRVLGSAWESNVDELLQDGPIDLVCFTGDLAHSGNPVEYAAVTEFIETLLKRLSLSIKRLFLVPGNHDIDRKKGELAWAELRGGKDKEGKDKKGKLLRVHPLDLSRWMAGGEPPLGLEGVLREDLLSRQGAYREWVATKLGRKELLPSLDTPHKFLGYRQTFRLPGHPFHLHVVGLDSAWLAGDENDRGNLVLTKDQVGRLTTDERGDPLQGFRLALVHHPLSELADKDDSQRLLADNVDLLLRGHLHEGAAEMWVDPNRTSRQLAAGCLYEGHSGDEWPNACHVVEITLDKEGRPLRYDLRFRSWSKRGYWHNDNSLYEGTQDGRLTWWIQKRLVRSPSVSATQNFVGRQQELEMLKAVLLTAERRPVAICAVHGMPGVGKSYLAERFAELHKEGFPGGSFRLVLDLGALPSVDVLVGKLGTQLGLPAQAQLLERCRERLLHPLSLLIVENVDSREAASVAGKFVVSLQECPIIVTGRFQGFTEGGGWTLVSVETLDEATALQLLEQEFQPAVDEDQRKHYKRLVHALGYLPLAMHLAAGYLRAGHSVESFLAIMRERNFDLEPVNPVDPSLLKDKARAIIRSTFDLSMELLRRQLGAGAKGERILSGFVALGHASLSGFGRSLGTAVAGISETEFGELIESTTLLSLLSRLPRNVRKDDAWRVHPLLAEILRGYPGSESGLTRMTEWFIARLPKLRPGLEQKQGEQWKEVYQESAALVDWLPRVPEAARIRVEASGSWFATHLGPFSAWMEFCDQALRTLQALDMRSRFLWTLAGAARGCGEMDKAFSAAQEKRALDQGRQDEHGAVLAAGILADIFQDRGELEEALRIRRDELPVYERLGDAQSRAMTLGKIAAIFQARGELDEALRVLREQVLPVFKQLGDVRSYAVTQSIVVDILTSRSEWIDALHLLRTQILPVFEQLGEMSSQGMTLVKIANIIFIQGELSEARQLLEKALSIFEQHGDVRARAVTLVRLADVFYAQGDSDEALRILKEEALPFYERIGDVPNRANALGHMADILQDLGRLDEALRIRTQEELPAYEKLKAERDRAITLVKVADILWTYDDLDKAMGMLKEALAVFERLKDAQSRATTYGRVADIFQSQGRLDEALRIRQEEELPVYERMGSIREWAVSLGKVADILQDQGRRDEALRILKEQVLPVFERIGALREQAITLDRIRKIVSIQ